MSYTGYQITVNQRYISSKTRIFVHIKVMVIVICWNHNANILIMGRGSLGRMCEDVKYGMECGCQCCD